jgi:hypothetical protein
MYSADILNSKVNIFTQHDESGKKYFKANVSFSENDTLSISRDNIEDLLNDLPQVLLPAIQARIVSEEFFINQRIA